MAHIPSAKTRVANGARWLDENFPGWEARINLDSLNLSDSCDCICGQVFEKQARRSRSDDVYDGFSFARKNLFSEANSWITDLVGIETVGVRRWRWAEKNLYSSDERKARKAMDLYDQASGRSHKVSVMLGFEMDNDMAYDLGYDSLQREWKRLLNKRLKEGTCSTA